MPKLTTATRAEELAEQIRHALPNPDWAQGAVNELEGMAADAEALAEALERLVAQVETNSEAGAPDYATDALARYRGEK